ncbi:MAG: ATP-binding protein [Nocardioidaceae bacterium]
MCRRADLALTPDLGAPARARRWLVDLCGRWQLSALREDAVLAASELVTNAVLHARTPLSVTAGVASGLLEVAVHDDDDRMPTVLPVRDDLGADIDDLLRKATGPVDDDDLRHPSWSVGAAGSIAAGRGLHLLDAVATCWGISVTPQRPGKQIWFGIALPDSWEHESSCRCADDAGDADDAGAEPLPSGHRVVVLPGPWDEAGDSSGTRRDVRAT